MAAFPPAKDPPPPTAAASKSADGDDTDAKIILKVGLVGDQSVGKTTLMVRYCENKFDEGALPCDPPV
jgi:hypothetical protein